MLDADNPAENTTTEAGAPEAAAPESPSGQPAGQGSGDDTPAGDTPAKKTAKRATKKSATKATATKSTAKKTAKKATTPQPEQAAGEPAVGEAADTPDAPVKPARKAAKKTAAKRTSASPEAAGDAPALPLDTAAGPAGTTGETATEGPGAGESAASAPAKKSTRTRRPKAAADAPADGPADAPAGEGADSAPGAPSVLFKAPDPTEATRPRRSTKKATPAEDQAGGDTPADVEETAPQGARVPDSGDSDGGEDSESGEGGGRRRRRRGGRRRRKGGEGNDNGEGSSESADENRSSESGPDGGPDSGSNKGAGKGSGQQSKQGAGKGSGQQSKQGSGKGSGQGGKDQGESDEEGGSRRRRRRRRSGEDENGAPDDPQNTVTRVRKSRSPEDEITALSGSTRLEAKKQRRREGREAGRRRAPIVSEAEFLARREAVDRVMVIRQRKELTQIAVLEDKVLVEHYVARESQTSLIGNVYLGRVQNVLPSMEAAFVDIGKGRNAVIYAGEVNWTALGAKDNQPRKIESVLKSGQQILVQVTKDPIGHKGARLTSQISLPGRFLVYVPDGTTSGISRKLPDTERNRLKAQLKEIVPDGAGVIVRTAAEGASEDELARDVERLTARWEDIEKKVKAGNAPQLLYGEPDLTLKVVRDLFTEDFGRLVVQGDEAWEMVEDYVQHVAPDLSDRLERHDPGAGDGAGTGTDVFAVYRIDEQIAKALDRKVWLPSGGSLIIDRTEAMTVVDVNTGKFTGSGGNLEETVTKNNLEAAEEMVRQLRLRDIGGIIVVDFIDMVLESNRDLVLRRMVECLGRDRTRHQVAEVTSLGLVQMTRKRIGTGLLEAFSENCEHCHGRGLVVHHEPVEPSTKPDDDSRRSRRGRGRGGDQGGQQGGQRGSDRGSNGGNGGTDNKDNEDNGGGKGSGAKPADQAGQSAQPADHAEGNGKPSPKDFAAMARREDEAGGQAAAPDSTPESKPSGGASDDSVTSAGAEPAEGADPAPVSTAPRTTTRRRSARRVQGPAGEAVAVSAGATETGAAQSRASESAPDGTGPVGTAAADAADAGTPADAGTAAEAPEPPAPRVVATTRRRTARRPAGPPAGEQPEHAPDE